MPRTYLVSKWGDVLVGMFAGGLAYYQYESKAGRSAQEGDRLVDLVRWKMDQRAKDKEGKEQVKAVEQEGWEELTKELQVQQGEGAGAGK
ncbi:hypothetical protein JCM6882_003414 [Rhodosporidiobolus microsporus]